MVSNWKLIISSINDNTQHPSVSRHMEVVQQKFIQNFSTQTDIAHQEIISNNIPRLLWGVSVVYYVLWLVLMLFCHYHYIMCVCTSYLALPCFRKDLWTTLSSNTAFINLFKVAFFSLWGTPIHGPFFAKNLY